MKSTDIIKLGIYNCFKKPIASILTVISFILIFTLVFMSFYYINYTTKEMENLVSGRTSLSYIMCEPASDNDVVTAIGTLKEEGLAKSIKIRSGLWQDEILSKLYKGEIASEEITNFRLSTGGKTYAGTNDNSYTFEIDEKNATAEEISSADRNIYFGIEILPENTPVIATDNELTEFRSKYPNDKIIRYGEEMTRNNEVMISDYMLEKFGVPESEFENIIGKEISISYFADGKETVLIGDSVLCGILSQNFFRVEIERGTPQFFVRSDNPSFVQFSNFKLKIQTDVPEFKFVEKYAKKLEGRNIGEINYNELTAKIYGDLEVEKEIMSFILTLVILVIIVAFIMNIYHIQYYRLQKKKYFFGLMNAIGMPKKYLGRLLFIELGFLSVGAAIISVILSIILLRAIAIYAEEIVGADFYGSFSEFVLPAILIIASAPIISYVITRCNEYQLRKENLVSLLNKSTVD